MSDVNLDDFENLNDHAPGEWGSPVSELPPGVAEAHGNDGGEWYRAPEPEEGMKPLTKVGGLIALAAVIGGGLWYRRRRKAAKEE